MTSRRPGLKQKKRRIRISAALGPDLEGEFTPEVTQILKEYVKVLLTLPVEKYGTNSLGERRDFAQRKAEVFRQRGPAVIGEETVQQILAIAFLDEMNSVTYAVVSDEEIEVLLAIGLFTGIYKLLQALESVLKKLPDEWLASFALDGMSADTFRTLADEFAGTFDELVEVARTL